MSKLPVLFQNVIWKMRWSILTLFLLLLVLASVATIFFNYYKNNEEISDLSFSRMQMVSRSVIQSIDGVTNQSKLIAQLTRGLISAPNDISSTNQALISYILNAMDETALVERIRIQGNNGNLISVTDLSQVVSETNMPNGAKYRVELIDNKEGNLTEIIEYRSPEHAIIGQEIGSIIAIDPMEQDWYRTVMMWPHLHWTSAYLPAEGQMIVYNTIPITNSKYEVYGAIGIDLSLKQLSNMVSHQVIGESGRLFILNGRGEILSPNANIVNKDSEMLNTIRIKWSLEKESNFRIQNDGISYLVSCVELPLSYEERWLLISIVPFKDFFGVAILIEKETVLISCAILFFFSIMIYLFAKKIAKPIARLAEQAEEIRRLDFKEYSIFPSHISEIVTLNNSFYAMRKALASFAKYTPKEVIKTLLEQGKEIEPGGERRDVVVVFSDIEHFTTTAETLPVEALFSSLSEYFSLFSKIIAQSEGTIDKYIGDSIMALWNAPQSVVDPAIKAATAVLRCLKTQQLKTENPFLKGHTRFGIHSGEVLVGNIGTSERLSYTAIGNVVNTASRLQSLSKEYEVYVMISEQVYEQLGGNFVTRPLDFLSVKGRSKVMTVFELVGIIAGEEALVATNDQVALCNGFTHAYRQFHEGKIAESQASFQELQKRFPLDFPIKLYLSRIQAIFDKKPT